MKAGTLSKIKKWGGIISAVVGILGALGTGWKALKYVSDLHDQIGENKVGLVEFRNQINLNIQEVYDHFGQIDIETREEFSEIENKLESIILVMREQRERDQEINTNLRIAVAELQAELRATRTSQPRSESSYRRSAAALDRVAEIQDEDPLSGLDGL